jgi:hypothetical protein
MPSVTGIISIRVGSSKLRVKEQTGKIDTGGWERTPHMVGGRVVGFSQTPKPAVISATLVHMADTDTEELNGYDGVNVIVETDTGVRWLVSNASTSKPVVVSGGGEVEFEMQGNPAEKQ